MKKILWLCIPLKAGLAFFLILISHITTLTSAFSQSQFQISYDYDGFDVVNSVKNTTGGYIAAGWAFGGGNLIPVGIAIETDFLGNIVWARRYRGDAFGLTLLTINDMQKTSAGGYIMTGVRGSRALLMNTTSTGTANWARGIGNNNDWGNGLKQTAAGDFVVAGATDLGSLNPTKDSTSIFVFKSNSAGTYQWGRTYTLTSPVFDSHDAAYDVVDVSGGHVFTGYHSQNNAGDTTTNILLLKTDASGTLLWMKSFGELGQNESGQRVIQLAGGDLLVAGYTDKTGFGDIFLIRTDALGNIVSSSAYNVGTFIAPEVNSLVQTASGEFAVFGWTATAAPPLFAYKPFLLKLNSSLEIQFTKHYNSQIGGFFVRGEEATSGGYIIGNMVGNVSWDLNLIKTDANGNSGCNENNYSSITKVYSPPTNNIAPIVYSVGSSSNFTPTVSNISPTPTVVCATTALASNAGNNVTICNGGSSAIGGSPTATGGTPSYTYAWTPATGLSCTNCANPTASPIITTTYTVTVTDGAANSSSSSMTVFVNPTPTASAGTGTSICPGGSTAIGGSPTATGGTPGYNYAWTPSASLISSVIANPTASPATTTTYTVVVTDALGCTSSSQVTVNVLSAPVASISGNTNICTGQTTTLTASGDGTYLWNTSATTATIIVSPAATAPYTVTVTGANGCTAAATATVTVNPVPTASISSPSSACSGSSVTLTASGGGTYLWNTGATTDSISPVITATTTYTVTVSNGTCSSSTTATVTMNPLPSANISGNVNICIGEITTLTASGGINYSWNTGATTISITDSLTTSTSYTVNVTDVNGCSATATVTVNVAPPPAAVISGNDTICAGQPTALTASGGLTYSWSTGATTTTINVAPTITTTYSVIVSVGSCLDSTSIIVTVNLSPTANISGNVNICIGETTTLTASGGGTYLWNTGATSTSISVSPTATTSYYTVTVTGANGCTAAATATVTVTPVPTATISPTSTICSGDVITLTAGGGTTYSWNPGGQTTSFIIVNPTSNTTYSVVVANGTCTDDTSVTVFVNPSPNADAGTNITINYGDNTTLTGSGGGTYLWNTGATTSTINVSPTTTTTYTLVVTYANGCADVDVVTVYIEFNCGDVFLPNAFSPNGDMKNDTFKVRSKCLRTMHFVIYNRWGGIVFETQDITKGWDGVYKGKEADPAVFFYVLNYELITGTAEKMKGTVSLIR